MNIGTIAIIHKKNDDGLNLGSVLNLNARWIKYKVWKKGRVQTPRFEAQTTWRMELPLIKVRQKMEEGSQLEKMKSFHLSKTRCVYRVHRSRECWTEKSRF